jgi:hypothetical protein
MDKEAFKVGFKGWGTAGHGWACLESQLCGKQKQEDLELKASLGAKLATPCLKIKMAQVVKCLPSIGKALCSIPSTAKKTKNKNKSEREKIGEMTAGSG